MTQITSTGGWFPNNTIIWEPQPTYYWHWPQYTEPSDCIGKAHVFECDHVESCKCGAIKRAMPKPKKTR